MRRLFYLFSILPLIASAIVGCAGASHQTVIAQYESSIKDDPLYFNLPRYRIDHLMKRVIILGKGEGKEQIATNLTQLFMSTGNIEVVEPGNAHSILKGKVLDYGTGLSPEDAKAIAASLRVDHVVLFEEENTPHRSYEHGGKHSTTIRLKIVNTTNGILLYQTVKEWGRLYPDPRLYRFSAVGKHSNYYSRLPCLGLLLQELRYALGSTYAGVVTMGDIAVDKLFSGSPADRAGLAVGDRILKVDEFEPRSRDDVLRVMSNAKQRDTQVVLTWPNQNRQSWGYLMQSSMEELNLALRSEGLPELQMGIGVNAGEVVVGNIGSESRAKYGIVGSPVNVTQRIQSAAKGGEVVISDAVLTPLGGEIRINRSFTSRLKGIDVETRLFIVDGFLPL